MKILKTGLWITAVGCLTAVPFIFLPWTAVERIGAWFSIGPLPDAPIAVYFFRVVFAVFGLIGIFYALLARNPFQYEGMLTLGAYGLIVFGLSALAAGISIGLPALVYMGDSLSGLVLGCVILFSASSARRDVHRG